MEKTGVLKSNGRGMWFLCNLETFQRDRKMEIFVPYNLIKEHGIPEGATLKGKVVKKDFDQVMTEIDTVCGLSVEKFKKRIYYKDLVATSPDERFDFSASKDEDLRIIDLISPMGKGTRGLIVSPPRAGKTILLEKLANGIRKASPDTRVMMLLLDERPEEVTHFKKNVDAEVLASSNDQSIEDHIELAEMTLKHITVELECGNDIVILMDSLTRMGRAFNVKGSNTGRTMSGGVEVGALEFPRRFFGMARNIENGGSITIIATVLIDTGSRMDQLIFEEFKGTGNSEIILDRKLAEERIFPAIDVSASGTRKEELLFKPGDVDKITILRRALYNNDKKSIIPELKKAISRYPTNTELLRSIKNS